MSESTGKIRVLIVDDNPDTVTNLKKLLYFEKDVEVAATGGTGDDAVRLAIEHQPDVVLMDINMPGMDGIAASEQITRQVPGTQIVIMSVQAEPDYLRRAMLAGAREFLIKPFSSEQLANTIRAVAKLGGEQRAAARQGAATGTPPAGSTTDNRVSATPARPAGQVVSAATLPPPAGERTITVPPARTVAPYTQAPASAPAAPSVPQGKVLVVFSASGGLGRSTLAANLAIALKEETRGRVALVDCSLRFGDVGVLLNLTSQQTIAEIASAEGGPDLEILADLMVSHPSGIKVMLAPSSPELAELVTAPAVRTILTALRAKFDYIVVDTFASLDEVTLNVLDVADRILLLTTSEIPAIKNTKLFFEVTEALKYPADKTLMILSKHDPRSSITAQDIQASIKHPVYAVIERDDRATTQAAQMGQPFVINQKNSLAALSIVRLAKLLVRPAADPAGESARAQPQQRRGLFR
ncbi:MAG: response regulator [Chloroflexi bacterium]|nr:response regulator [Chloroflexota bacterium]